MASAEEQSSSLETRPEVEASQPHSEHSSSKVVTIFEELCDLSMAQPDEVAAVLPTASAEDAKLSVMPPSGEDSPVPEGWAQTQETDSKAELSSNLVPALPTAAPPTNGPIIRVSESGETVTQPADQKHNKKRRPPKYKLDLSPVILADQTKSKAGELQESIFIFNLTMLQDSPHGDQIDHLLAINFNREEKMKKLGSGGHGAVYLFTPENPSDIRMAVKVVPYKTKEEDLLATYAELNALSKIRRAGSNPYIVDHYGEVLDNKLGELCICMEPMQTSMAKFYPQMHSMNGSKRKEIEWLVRRCAHNVIKALHFLETQRIMHGDIKPANILINDTAQIKLCDFGISGDLDNHQYDFPATVGTVAYQPYILKESQIQGEKRAIQSDMWSLGITLLEMLTGRHPFPCDYDDVRLSFDIARWSLIVPTTVSSDLQELLLKLLKKDSQERPGTFLEIINTTFIGKMSEIPSDVERLFAQRVLGCPVVRDNIHG